MKLSNWLVAFSVIATMFGAGRQAVAADPGISPTEVTLGMWTPLTGPTSLLGTSERDAIEIAIDEINAAGGVNGRKIKLIAYDDAGSPQEALTSVRRLIDQDGVFALIAGSISGATLPVVPLVNRSKIPFISSISSNRKLLDPFSHYIFRVYANELAHADGIVNYALSKGIKKPAIIYNSNDYGVGGEEEVSALLDKAKIPLVAKERYNQTDQDFSAQLLRIKESGADSMFLWAFAAEAGIIVRQARELGLTIPIYGGAGISTPLFTKAVGNLGKGIVAAYVVPDLPESSTKPAVAKYRETLKKKYGGSLPPGRPNEYDLGGYAALKIFAAALAKAGANPTRESLIAALETLKDFDTGVTFPVTYTSKKHEGTDQTSLLRVGDSGEWELLGENK
ncbi:MAG TPA: ABC transporter substrate-binding protein [Bradyrhizobium sp.]|nr:ABC transporter substrate-binding protein [Bradyrhizobium sp.]